MSDLTLIRLSESFTASAQLLPADFAALASLGVKTVINNRPDGEEPGQLTAADAIGLAAANGMSYQHIPVRLAEMSQIDVGLFAAALAKADGPVHAHCRSGVRSVTLWALGEVTAGRLTPDRMRAVVTVAGFDAKPALAWLSRHPAGSGA